MDFGASDSPMTDEQMAKVEEGVVHIPSVLGSVVLSYNLAGATGKLKLTGELIADIFLGTIKKWDDPRILKVNPGMALKGDIIVAHRSDGSGTTGVFTDYLAKVSPTWKEKVGQGTAVNWPTGLGGKGNVLSGNTDIVADLIGYYLLDWSDLKKTVTTGGCAILAASAGPVRAVGESSPVPFEPCHGHGSRAAGLAGSFGRNLSKCDRYAYGARPQPTTERLVGPNDV